MIRGTAVSGVGSWGRAPSRKARRRGAPQRFCVNTQRHPRYTSSLKWPTRPAAGRVIPEPTPVPRGTLLEKPKTDTIVESQLSKSARPGAPGLTPNQSGSTILLPIIPRSYRNILRLDPRARNGRFNFPLGSGRPVTQRTNELSRKD